MNKFKYILTVAMAGLPFIALAESNKTLKDLIGVLAVYMNDALALLMGFAVLAFVFYVIKYFIVQSDDTKRAEAAQYVMWSIIGFFAIFSLWGLVNILISTFDLGGGSPTSWTGLNRLFPN